MNKSNLSLSATQEMSTVKIYNTNNGLIHSVNFHSEYQTTRQDILLGNKQHDTK